ncbi:MAG TPA: methyltransferase [Chloroflexi bacterium]|nr:methyltransferase [Chloroflexota bacterium]
MARNSREQVLRLLRGEKIDYVPNFSGMGSITLHGLKQLGYRFNEVHVDARKMADAAASTHRHFGFESAIVPFDMGVEAEALGAEVKYYDKKDEDQIIYPVMSKKLAETVDELEIRIPENLAEAGRIPVVLEALRILKREVGDDVAVGSWVLGPFTELGQVVNLENLLKMSFKKQALVHKLLDDMVEYLSSLVALYVEAGADFITVREMGATSSILSPRMFEKLVLPHLQELFGRITVPTVLHICGNTNPIIHLMARSAANALSVDQLNDLARTRQELGDVVLLGNYNAFDTLCNGAPADVEQTIKEAIERGADGIWPGCDIWPTVPAENMQAMMEATRRYGLRP